MRLAHKKIERDQILDRYWQLAGLDAEETKGNIMGQLKALEALCDLTLKPAETGKTLAQPGERLPTPIFYRPDHSLPQ